MKCLSKMVVFGFCLGHYLFADGSPNWQIDGVNEGWKDEFTTLQYFHHSELQRQWAWHILGQYHFLGEERVLDFGCGDGKITAEMSHFIPSGSVLGVDTSASMIAFAQRCFPTRYFPNLHFELVQESDYEKQKYDLIYSFCVLHLVSDPVAILKSLQSCLNPDGILLLVIPAGNNPAFFQAANEMFQKYQLTPPWSSKRDLATFVTMRTKEGCLECMKMANLEPIEINVLHNPTMFYNQEELAAWMIGTVSANWKIPVNLSEVFFHDLIDRMVEIDPDVVDESGGFSMKLSRIELVAKNKG